MRFIHLGFASNFDPLKFNNPDQSGTQLEVARAYLVIFVNVIHTIIPTLGFELNVASVTKSPKHPTWTWGIPLDFVKSYKLVICTISVQPIAHYVM